MLKCYTSKSFEKASQDLIDIANDIITEYMNMGYDLTLRQLYYQFVARDHVPNTEASYNRIGRIVSEARLAGLMSWNSIIDRTRNFNSNPHWSDPENFLHEVAPQYGFDTRKDQDYHIEVWVEKEALAGVVGEAANQLDVMWFSCRGYVSQSAMWRASQRIIRKEKTGKKATILHLGDHDPSGIDMTRDIQERLMTFGSQVVVHRIALNMEQISHYTPPPNPTKLSDSRANDYVVRYGNQSWELDALDPRVIHELIQTHVTRLTDIERWESNRTKQEVERTMLVWVADNWNNIRDDYENQE